MKRLGLLLLTGAMLCSAGTALADEEEGSTLCPETTCSSNEKLVAFADGNRQTCSCQANGGDMVDTVAEEADSPGSMDAGYSEVEAVEAPSEPPPVPGADGWGDGA